MKSDYKITRDKFMDDPVNSLSSPARTTQSGRHGAGK